jgi:hypothetical protein
VEISDFSVEKWKRNEKIENGNGNLRNGNGNGIFLTEVETEMERRFLVEHMRKWKILFLANMEFPFYGCFAWLEPCHIKLSKQPTPTPPLH